MIRFSHSCASPSLSQCLPSAAFCHCPALHAALRTRCSCLLQLRRRRPRRSHGTIHHTQHTHENTTSGTTITLHTAHNMASATMHPAALQPRASSDAPDHSGSVRPRCPSLATANHRAASLPDLFLPADGSPSRGWTDPSLPGRGAGVALDAERRGASFDQREMTRLLYGGEEKLARRREINAVVENDPVFRKWDRCFLSRPERLRRAREKAAAAVGHMRRMGLTDPMEVSQFFSHIDEQLPTELHRSMFTPTILSQASEEQQREWLPMAQEYRVLGTYAQTELGHGSFVRGMETTATFDPATDSFVLNTPTLTATKWWPGCLGKNTTHAVLMARLIDAQGTDHSVHAFMLQLRDTETYELLPGRETGDIGPKVGYESNDNGFLRLDNVRVPRSALFARFARMTPEGRYERVPGAHEKSAFATMVFVRSMIVIYAARHLARALTIAVRYSAVRKQFPDPWNPSGGEMAVLNYQTQQHALFPLLATCFAFHFSGSYMRRLYERNRENLAAGDSSLMAELHATSAGLKAVTTALTSEGLEVCRRACGGHGYSRFCGIYAIWQDYVPAQTYEGENTVMLLQTARGLMKTFQAVRKGKIVFNETQHQNQYYMTKAAWLGMEKLTAQRSSLKVETLASQSSSAGGGNGSGGGDSTAETIAIIERTQYELFAHRAARLLLVASVELESCAKQHPQWTYEQCWEQCKVALVALARAHCMLVLVINFHNALRKLCAGPRALSPALQRVLRDLCDLFCWSMVERDLGEFCADGFLSLVQCTALRARVLALLRALRPNAVAIVDAFDFSDFLLNSALGRADGDVYACMMEWARRNPINDEEVATGVPEYIIPLLAGTSKL